MSSTEVRLDFEEEITTWTDSYATSPTSPECRVSTADFFLSETTVVFLLAILENLLAVGVIGSYKSRKNNTNTLLLLMAGNDLTSATFALVSSLGLLFTCESLDRDFCNFLGLVTFVLFCWSLHIVAVMNVERYLMICHPIYHRNQVNGRFLGVLCGAGIAFITILIGLPLVGVGRPYLLYNRNKLCAFDVTPGRRVHNALLVICSLLGIFYVGVTVATNYAMTKKMKAAPSASRQQGTDGQAVAKSKKMQSFNLVTKVVTGVNCLLTLPFYLKLMVATITEDEDIEGIEDSFSTTLWVMTPVVNPILYIAFNKNYRRHLGNMWARLGCVCCRDNQVLPMESVGSTSTKHR